MEAKIKAFEYFVFKLKEWYEEKFSPEKFINNDLSKLKIFKLHFFVTAISSSQNDDGLLAIFDEFYALPYGPVESYIYDHLDSLVYFKITNSSLNIKEEININDISNTNYQAQIDSSIKKLKSIDPDLIKYPAFDLVELSHNWSCWSIVFDYAKSNNMQSSKIPEKLIQIESQKKFQLMSHNYAF